LQVAGGRQSASAVQDALQAAMPHRYGKHDDVVGVWQLPAPSQVDSAVNRLLAVGQVAGMQGVPAVHFWQAPAWHLPFVPQVAESCIAHIPVGSGAPLVTAEHMPGVPAMHDLHAVLQAPSQQTPWAQNVLRHSTPFEQEAPSSLRPHELLMQVLGDTHWLSLVHALKQRALPLQVKGLHGTSSGAAHCPDELQVEGPL
jgi:hypothetical protein